MTFSTSPVSSPRPRMGALVDIGTLPLPVSIVITLTCRAAALAMAWPVVREVPPRGR